MKKLFTTKFTFNTFLNIFFFLLFNKATSQTWINTIFYDNANGQTVNHDSLSIGPLEMVRTPNGNIISLVQISQDEDNNLILTDNLGHIYWNSYVSHSGGIFSEMAFGLKPALDNGCVLIVLHLSAPNDYSKTCKITPNGTIEWMKTDYYPFLASSIIPTVNNTYFIQYSIQDSLVEVDSYGNFIRKQVPFSGTISTMHDSDFIVFKNIITRQNFNGTAKWTIPLSNFEPIFVDTNYIYCKNGFTVIKIRTNDGSQVWTKSITYNGISVTSDGGLITCGGINSNQISRYDSTGNQLWSRNIPFPQFGYKNIIEDEPNSYVTGGAYKCIFLYRFNLDHGFSYFLTSLDSLGNGVVDSTDYYFTGNANDNLQMSFSDDAAYIGAALGNTGLPRLPVFQNFWQSVAAFGTDWQTGFPAGINYKFSDVDGNGTIDTSDIRKLSEIFPSSHYSPSHWRQSNVNSSFPELKFSISGDTILAGDTATIYVTIGSNANAVDSIYSISFTINHGFLFNPASFDFNVPTNDLGDPNVNLYSFVSTTAFSGAAINILLTRTDHTNAYLNGDTISIIRIPANIGFPSILTTINFNYNAITKSGFEVDLYPVTDTFLYFNPTLTIPALIKNEFSIYPNPSSGKFNINYNFGLIEKLTVFNHAGIEILRKEDFYPTEIINLENYPSGLYYIRLRIADHDYFSKIQIVH